MNSIVVHLARIHELDAARRVLGRLDISAAGHEEQKRRIRGATGASRTATPWAATAGPPGMAS